MNPVMASILFEYNILLWGFGFLVLGFIIGFLYGLYKYLIKHWREVKAISQEIYERRRKK